MNVWTFSGRVGADAELRTTQSGEKVLSFRVANDIGFGDREYWAFTNEHGQLVRVVAAEIILQDDAPHRALVKTRACAAQGPAPPGRG